MKAYTDIEQGKKLAEILPIESADMHYARIDYTRIARINWKKDNNEMEDWKVYLSPVPKICALYIEDVPCWSLAALLEVIPWVTLEKMDIEENWRCRASLGLELPEHSHGDNPIDACVEMILKLKKKGVI